MCLILSRKAHVPCLRNNLPRYPFSQKGNESGKPLYPKNVKTGNRGNQSEPYVYHTRDDA